MATAACHWELTRPLGCGGWSEYAPSTPLRQAGVIFASGVSAPPVVVLLLFVSSPTSAADVELREMRIRELAMSRTEEEEGRPEAHPECRRRMRAS